MVFGWTRSSSPNAATDTRSLATAALEAGASDVSWSPLTTAPEPPQKPKQPQPFKVQAHDIKAHLQDRSTAVVNLRSVVDAPSDVLFDLLSDPHQHERIFDAIESATAELVSEEGPVRKWRLDYVARWKFWKVGGKCDNRLWMTTDRERGTVSFALREPGFLRKYEGTWTITGPDGKGPGAARHGPAAATTTGQAPTSPTTACDSAAFTPASAHGPSSSSSRSGFSSGRPSADLTSPPSPFAGCSTSGASDASPRSHALLNLSRSGSSSSSSSSNSNDDCFERSISGISNLSGSSAALPGAETPPAAARGRPAAAAPSLGFFGNLRSAGGGGGGGGGLAGLFAAINNPFTAGAHHHHRLPVMAALRPLATGRERTEWSGGDELAAGTRASPPQPPQPPPERPRYPTTIQIRKEISPKISPPYPINQVLKGHACGQVNDMLEGLLAATARRISTEEVMTRVAAQAAEADRRQQA